MQLPVITAHGVGFNGPSVPSFTALCTSLIGATMEKQRKRITYISRADASVRSRIIENLQFVVTHVSSQYEIYTFSSSQ